MGAHQLAHSVNSHTAQFHFYGCLLCGLLLLLLTLGAIIGLIYTAPRRSQRDLQSASISISGVGLVSASVLLNAFVPLKHHHFADLLIPISGPGAVLFLCGLIVSLVGIYLMPKGKAGNWLSVQKKHAAVTFTESEIWPPAPKI